MVPATVTKTDTLHTNCRLQQRLRQSAAQMWSTTTPADLVDKSSPRPALHTQIFWNDERHIEHTQAARPEEHIHQWAGRVVKRRHTRIAAREDRNFIGYSWWEFESARRARLWPKGPVLKWTRLTNLRNSQSNLAQLTVIVKWRSLVRTIGTLRSEKSNSWYSGFQGFQKT